MGHLTGHRTVSVQEVFVSDGGFAGEETPPEEARAEKGTMRTTSASQLRLSAPRGIVRRPPRMDPFVQARPDSMT
jgi:hypothetical protein